MSLSAFSLSKLINKIWDIAIFDVSKLLESKYLIIDPGDSK